MNWPEFKKKWGRFTGKESLAYQEHFNDLCRLLGHESPAHADPSGSESFCFQKRVVKDGELFVLKEDGSLSGANDVQVSCRCRFSLFAVLRHKRDRAPRSAPPIATRPWALRDQRQIMFETPLRNKTTSAEPCEK